MIKRIQQGDIINSIICQCLFEVDLRRTTFGSNIIYPIVGSVIEISTGELSIRENDKDMSFSRINCLEATEKQIEKYNRAHGV
jgi:hypothetical protein